MKDTKLTLETAKVMYKEGGAGKLFALDNYTESELIKKGVAKSWKDLVEINGVYVSNNAEVVTAGPICLTVYIENKGVFPTKQDAESSLALAQLLQLRKAVIGDWVPNWDEHDGKYTIYRFKNHANVGCSKFNPEFISFPAKEMAEEFLSNHRELIEVYFKLK